MGMKVFSAIASAITGSRLTDTSSGFQAVRRKVFSLFALGSYPVDFPDADTLIWVARHGFSIGEIAVVMHQRRRGKSMISGADLVAHVRGQDAAGDPGHRPEDSDK